MNIKRESTISVMLKISRRKLFKRRIDDDLFDKKKTYHFSFQLDFVAKKKNFCKKQTLSCVAKLSNFNIRRNL